MPCADCGAVHEREGDSCQQRFDQLLALDHSRREPWGSRHAVAFAVYALQHPSHHSDATRVIAVELLTRVYQRGEPLARVVVDLRARQLSPRAVVEASAVPSVRGPFSVTIVALGDFSAERYVDDLDDWARSTLDGLSGGRVASEAIKG